MCAPANLEHTKVENVPTISSSSLRIVSLVFLGSAYNFVHKRQKPTMATYTEYFYLFFCLSSRRSCL